jgi:hypothetical protein
MNAVFNDPRAALVPAHLLVRDRYDSEAASSTLHIPSLWIENLPSAAPKPLTQITAPKTLLSLNAQDPAFAAQRSAALTRWLDDLSVNPARP